MDYFNFISGKIRQLRKTHGYSLEKLAALASKKGHKVTKDLIHNIEKKRVSSFDPNILSSIAAVFGESLSDFFAAPGRGHKTDIADYDSDELGRLLVSFKKSSPENVSLAVETVTELLHKLENRDSVKNILEYESDKPQPKGTVPVYELEIAAGYFAGESSAPEPEAWLKVRNLSSADNYFAARIRGKSMEPLITDGSLCLFKKYSGGSRQGRIMLVRTSGITDPVDGGSFVIKRYKRKSQSEIHLVSENPDFPDIILKDLSDEQISTPCEFVKVVS